MRSRFFLFAAITFFASECADGRREEDLVVAEGRKLIQSTYAKYAASKDELAQYTQSKKDYDLLKLIQENTNITLDLYTGIKAMAKKYPAVSKKYAENPNLLGRQLGADLQPLFQIVNKLAANIRTAMKTYPEKEKTRAAYQELMLAWVKVLTVFGTELK